MTAYDICMMTRNYIFMKKTVENENIHLSLPKFKTKNAEVVSDTELILEIKHILEISKY